MISFPPKIHDVSRNTNNARQSLASGAALVLLLLTSMPAPAADCGVLDPELQGFYEGGCKRGLAHGQGYARGSAEYEGEFRNGMKHGQGVKTWPWGDRYEGGFVDDRKHGAGMYVWGAGSPWADQRYVGEFKADKRDGLGTYYWPNGDRFDGQWKDDLRYGYTAMEQRREAARKAREEALGPVGTQVCMTAQVEIAQQAWIRGETQGLADGRLKVRVTQVGLASAEVRPVDAPGDLLESEIWDWTPCL